MTAPYVRRRAAGAIDTLPDSLHPVLRRVYASRGVGVDELELEFRHLLPPAGLHGIAPAAPLVAGAIRHEPPLVTHGVYGCEDLTRVAVCIRGQERAGQARLGGT